MWVVADGVVVFHDDRKLTAVKGLDHLSQALADAVFVDGGLTQPWQQYFRMRRPPSALSEGTAVSSRSRNDGDHRLAKLHLVSTEASKWQMVR